MLLRSRTVLGQSNKVKPVSAADVFRLFFNMSGKGEALHGEEAPYFWNSLIKRASDVENMCLKSNGVAQYSFIIQLVIHPVVKDLGWLMQGM